MPFAGSPETSEHYLYSVSLEKGRELKSIVTKEAFGFSLAVLS